MKNFDLITNILLGILGVALIALIAVFIYMLATHESRISCYDYQDYPVSFTSIREGGYKVEFVDFKGRSAVAQSRDEFDRISRELLHDVIGEYMKEGKAVPMATKPKKKDSGLSHNQALHVAVYHSAFGILAVPQEQRNATIDAFVFGKDINGDRIVTLPIDAAAKIVLHNSMLKAQIMPERMAEALDVPLAMVRELLDLDWGVNLRMLADALKITGRKLDVGVYHPWD